MLDRMCYIVRRGMQEEPLGRSCSAHKENKMIPWSRTMNTLKVVFGENEFHHTALGVDFDPMPCRQLRIRGPVILSIPIIPTGRTKQGSQYLALRQCLWSTNLRGVQRGSKRVAYTTRSISGTRWSRLHRRNAGDEECSISRRLEETTVAKTRLPLDHNLRKNSTKTKCCDITALDY